MKTLSLSLMILSLAVTGCMAPSKGSGTPPKDNGGGTAGNGDDTGGDNILSTQELSTADLQNAGFSNPSTLRSRIVQAQSQSFLATSAVGINTGSCGDFRRADLNHSDRVDFDDLLLLSQSYNTLGVGLKGDVNRDGAVDFDDLLELSQRYNTSRPSGCQAYGNQLTVGVNVDRPLLYTQDEVFADAAKTGRIYLYGSANPAPVQARTWPNASNWRLEVFRDLIMADVANRGGTCTVTDTTGCYTLVFDGSGDVTVDGYHNLIGLHEINYQGARRRIGYIKINNPRWISSVESDSITGLNLNFANVPNWDLARNVAVYRPGIAVASDGTVKSPINPLAAKYISQFSYIRFMDFMATNGSFASEGPSLGENAAASGKLTNGNPQTNWSDRPLPTDPSQTSQKGVALEYVIALANSAGVDAWINVPISATDAYVTQMATLIKNQLRSDLHVYVEWSNEVWNFSFPQYDVNMTMANAAASTLNRKTLWECSGQSPQQQGETAAAYEARLRANCVGQPSSQTWMRGDRNTVKRLLEISTIFRNTFGEYGALQPNARVRPMLGSFSACSGTVDAAGFMTITDRCNFEIAKPLRLQLDYLKSFYGDAKDFIYGAAHGPYINSGNQNGMNALDARLRDSLNEEIKDMRYFRKVIDEMAPGVKQFAYEAGMLTFGYMDNQARYDYLMNDMQKDMLKTYLTTFFACGGSGFGWFTATGSYWSPGNAAFGLTNSILRMQTPRIQGMREFLEQTTYASLPNCALDGSRPTH